MLNLVVKDALIQKRSFGTSIILALGMMVAMQSSAGNGAYMMGSMGIVFLLLAGAFAYDEKSRSDTLINSLPLKRNDVVIARYASLIIFTSIAVIIVAAIGSVFKLTGLGLKLEYITLPDIVGIYFTIAVMFSIYLPLFFKYGYYKLRIASVFLYILVFAISGLITGLRQVVSENPDDMFVKSIISAISMVPDWLVGPIIVIVTLLILFISLCISMRVYKKREF